MPPRVDAFRITALKDLGANMWRGSYPSSNSLMDLADQHGMLMWVENRFLRYKVQPVPQPLGGDEGGTSLLRGGAIPAADLADPQLLRDIHDMVLRDRNHPSNVIYSLCNEAGCPIGDPYGGVMGAQFKAAINAGDTTRPITANTEWSLGSPDTFNTVLDVMTCSYNYKTYELYHKHHPFRPFMGGESASCQSDRGFFGPTNKSRGLISGDAAPACCATAWAAAGSTDFGKCDNHAVKRRRSEFLLGTTGELPPCDKVDFCHMVTSTRALVLKCSPHVPRTRP